MPFIVATDVKKVDRDTRKFIRSHVMLGKNQGKSRKSRYARRTQPVSLEATPNSSTSPDELLDPSSCTSCSTIPDKVGSEISFICFADTMQPYMAEVVLNCRCFRGHPLHRS